MYIKLDVSSVLQTLLEEMDLSKSSITYCLRRLRNEGPNFVTKTLPKLSAALLRSLNLGFFDRSELTDFRWKGRALANFRELTDLIFDQNGALLVEPCPIAIYRVRQFCDYLYKLALDVVAATTAHVESFIKTDESIGDAALDMQFIDTMRKNIETFYDFPSLEDVLSTYRPRFGPGTYSVDSNYPSSFAYYANKTTKYSYVVPDRFRGICGAFKSHPGTRTRNQVRFGPDTSEYSELLFVPKDSRGPRAIVREPMQRLALQMSFFDFFSSFLQKNTRGRINFTDQQVNRNLAQLGSVDGSWATIDLKEASDRVSLTLVKHLSKNIPVLRYFVKERSKYVVLPDSSLHKLNKLAGMGSGLTFSFLAFVCHTSITTLVSKRLNIPFKHASKYVYVYGDDIIVPTHLANIAKDALGMIGLLINNKKSFTELHLGRTKYFRESCGGDFFGGSDVSIVRAKFTSAKPSFIKEEGRFFLLLEGENAVNQINAHCKELVKNGMTKLSELYYKALTNIVGNLPIITNFETNVIGRYTRKYVAYDYDDCGNYKPIKVLVPTPVVGSHEDEDDQRYLAKSVSPGGVADRLSHLAPCASGGQQYTVAVPHKVVLRRVQLCQYALMR